MYIHLDAQRMELQLVGDVMESYSPSEEVKEIDKSVKELKAKWAKFISEEIQPHLEAINQRIDAENQKNVLKNE